MKSEIIIESPDEKRLRLELERRTDVEARRIKRFLAMPDLSRTEGSPLRELAERIVAIPEFNAFDILKVPEIVPARESFDLFNFPASHPARSRSDTYYVDDDYILRTHTTVMWYYHLRLEAVKHKIAAKEPLGALSYGKVYRKDEIDRTHMNVFHNMDGWYLCPKEQKVITLEDLKSVLIRIAEAIYGQGVSCRFNQDTFPYTDPSIEMEINLQDPATGSRQDRWIEVLGSGVVRPVVIKNLSAGIDMDDYNGWAFGFGLERLAMLSMNLPDIRLLWSGDPRVTRQLVLGNAYKEVSKYPSITRDISFVVDADFVPNNYFDLIRDIGGELVEEVSLLDRYENPEKFGQGKTSYTYRIVYRSNERTLTTDEIAPLQDRLVAETKNQFRAEVR